MFICPCRYQAAYRELAKKHPSFRERSETTELIVDISLQVNMAISLVISPDH
jgi:uroporphyrinogen-III decarboxylase